MSDWKSKFAKLLLLLSLFWTSCEEPVDIDLRTGPTRLVVEGWITDLPGPHRVKLTTTDNFTSEFPTPTVSQARIRVRDDQGNVHSLEEAAPGVYLTDSASFVGIPGRAYQVSILLRDGSRYESDFQMLKSVAPIDSITTYYVEDPIPNNNEEDGEGHYALVGLTDPPELGDFYRWKVARNSTFYDRPEDQRIDTDRFVNGNHFSVDFDNFPMELGDTCLVQQMSLTSDAFDFLRLLTIQAIEIGQSTSTSPSIVRGNLYSVNNPDEVVLGFFSASSVAQKQVIMQFPD